MTGMPRQPNGQGSGGDHHPLKSKISCLSHLDKTSSDLFNSTHKNRLWPPSPFHLLNLFRWFLWSRSDIFTSRYFWPKQTSIDDNICNTMHLFVRRWYQGVEPQVTALPHIEPPSMQISYSPTPQLPDITGGEKHSKSSHESLMLSWRNTASGSWFIQVRGKNQG